MKYLPLLFALLCLSIHSKEVKETVEVEARIYYSNEGTWSIVTENFDETKAYVAKAFYDKKFEEYGWDELHITTNKIFSDQLQAEAAGRIEGYLTKDRILYHYENLLSIQGELSYKEKAFFNKQRDFILEEYARNPYEPHIYNAYLIYLQFKGMVDEYNNQQTEFNRISETNFNLMAAFGDMIEIHDKYRQNRKRFDDMTAEELKLYFFLNSHCSALFKVKADMSEVFSAHNSWYYYSMMNRIFKEYNFNYNHPSVKAKSVIFSSYAATLSSNDDFYVTSNDLNVIETTNVFFNDTFLEEIVPESLLTWQRVIIANRMSETGEEWSSHFSPYNSGTYNNMYMVLDMKNIDLDNNSINNKTLFTVEQIPNLVKANDVTKQLRYGYWPSYNTPYDKEIIARSLIQEKIKEMPQLVHEFDYDTCTRATIMRRDQAKISSIDDMKTFIRYNNYTNDPLAFGDPTATISARGDLMEKQLCYGAYDAKVASVREIKGKKKTIHVVAGPTYSDVEPFDFTKVDGCTKMKRHGLKEGPMTFEWFTVETKFEA